MGFFFPASYCCSFSPSCLKQHLLICLSVGVCKQQASLFSLKVGEVQRINNNGNLYPVSTKCIEPWRGSLWTKIVSHSSHYPDKNEDIVILPWVAHLLWPAFFPPRKFPITLVDSSSSTRRITLNWLLWISRSQKIPASMNVMPPTPLALPPFSPSSGYGATLPHFGLFWEFWLKSSSLWWSLLCMRRGRGQMRFLMVRASQQNSKVGVGSLGSFQVLKEEYKELV